MKKNKLRDLREYLDDLCWDLSGKKYLRLADFFRKIVKKIAVLEYRIWKEKLLPSNEFDSEFNHQSFARHLPKEIYNEYVRELIRKRNNAHEMEFVRPVFDAKSGA